MSDYLPANLSLLQPLGVMLLLIIVLAGLGKVPISYNLRNLCVRWKTTLMTALAFTLVIALLVIMLAFVAGMDQLTQNSGNPANVMILAEGATDELFSNLPNFDPRELPGFVKEQIVRDDRGEFLVSQEAYVLVNFEIPNPQPGGPVRRFLQMRGIRDVSISAQVHDMELLKGEWISPQGVRAFKKEIDGKIIKDAAHEVVMGEGIARVLGEDTKGNPLAPGDVIKIGPRWWIVAGIMASEGSTFGSEIWARDIIIGDTFGRQNSYSVYVARAPNAKVADIAARVLREGKVRIQGSSVQAFTEREYYSKLDRTNQVFSGTIYFVAVIMAIGGVLGVMNTMFAAISQRAADIGVLRLLGFGRGEILVSFLLESLVIALVGGLLGCGIGSLAHGWSATSVISAGPGGGKIVVMRMIVDGNILAVALMFTVGMGLLGGLLPSLSAMRLKPLESLR